MTEAVFRMNVGVHLVRRAELRRRLPSGDWTRGACSFLLFRGGGGGGGGGEEAEEWRMP